MILLKRWCLAHKTVRWVLSTLGAPSVAILFGTYEAMKRMLDLPPD